MRAHRLTLAAVGLALVAALSAGGVEPERPPALRIVYTVDTLGQVNTCGCSGGQHGGLPRRATALRNLAAPGIPVVTLDGGAVVQAGPEVSYLASAHAAMGYRLVLPAGADLTARSQDDKLLSDELATRGVGVLARPGDAEGGPLPTAVLDAGNGWSVLVLAGPGDSTVPAEVVAARARLTVGQAIPHPSPLPAGEGTKADGRGHVAVLLATRLDAEGNRRLAELLGDAVDVILGASSPARSRDYRDPIPEGKAIPAVSQGKALTVIEVYPGENGGRRIQARFEPVSPDLVEDPTVGAIVERYYTEAAPASRPAERDEDRNVDWALRGWVDPEACGGCHVGAYEAWRNSAHSRAVPTLRGKGRLVDECLGCHSEEFRRNGAFDPASVVPGDGVACTTCHGPGLAHTLTGMSGRIERSPDEAACRSCHTEEQQPAGFVYADALARIAHGLDAVPE